MLKDVKIIGFDADDTLWVNETYYRDTEEKYVKLMLEYADRDTIMSSLFSTEMKNLSCYGYGIKAFVLSMVENGISISKGRISPLTIQSIISMGKEMLQLPIELLPGVKEVLEELKGSYKLIVATKGDLLDQEGKLIRSSLSGYFHHIEIMSDKQKSNYQGLLNHLEIPPRKFVMIGNSLKSDIIPPLELGCFGIYVPFHTTWQHEKVDHLPESDRFFQLNQLTDVLPLLV